ncbi:hypothetical protein M514_24121 [Trichuris suis]|uniref:Uncharacterized protein n=1 Tax=Trichuris suis TaxID=68888 RepID=A0A085N2I1_9BILA|nr:hypothetical protein M514_24121 [Trichuris suis]
MQQELKSRFLAARQTPMSMTKYGEKCATVVVAVSNQWEASLSASGRTNNGGSRVSDSQKLTSIKG